MNIKGVEIKAFIELHTGIDSESIHVKDLRQTMHLSYIEFDVWTPYGLKAYELLVDHQKNTSRLTDKDEA